MSRVKRGTMVRARHKKVLKAAKGYRGGNSKRFKSAKQTVQHAGMHAYRSRKVKKRDFRALWSSRLTAALKPIGLNYSRFINVLFKKEVVLNRKVLSEMAFNHPQAFDDLVKKVK
ncbi:MAG: 50S ribosomal protein L20 [Candidatus Altimarinota bacterium]